MTLTEYIEKIKAENGIQFDTAGIEKHINDKARKANGHKSGCICIDDETVKKWILEYDPTKEATEKFEKIQEEKEEKEMEKPVGVPKKETGEWGEQQSLF
jgi:precorrin isomerase